MFLKTAFVVSLLMLSTTSSQKEQLAYNNTLLQKEVINGLEIKELSSSSYSKGIFSWFQKVYPSSTSNPFNGTQNLHRS